VPSGSWPSMAPLLHLRVTIDLDRRVEAENLATNYGHLWRGEPVVRPATVEEKSGAGFAFPSQASRVLTEAEQVESERDTWKPTWTVTVLRT
jgi:hypothetical protein